MRKYSLFFFITILIVGFIWAANPTIPKEPGFYVLDSNGKYLSLAKEKLKADSPGSVFASSDRIIGKISGAQSEIGLNLGDEIIIRLKDDQNISDFVMYKMNESKNSRTCDVLLIKKSKFIAVDKDKVKEFKPIKNNNGTYKFKVSLALVIGEYAICIPPKELWNKIDAYTFTMDKND